MWELSLGRPSCPKPVSELRPIFFLPPGPRGLCQRKSFQECDPGRWQDLRSGAGQQRLRVPRSGSGGHRRRDPAHPGRGLPPDSRGITAPAPSRAPGTYPGSRPGPPRLPPLISSTPPAPTLETDPQSAGTSSFSQNPFKA